MCDPDDPFTMELRLCDDDGMALLDVHNRLARTPWTGEPWPCTSHAHLAGEHIRCTSPAHARGVTVGLDPAGPDGWITVNASGETLWTTLGGWQPPRLNLPVPTYNGTGTGTFALAKPFAKP